MTQWIDFKELRANLSFTDVLKTYDVAVKFKGNQAHGFCPLPTHRGEGRSPSFSANIVKGIWQCFGCGAKGNVLDLAVRMEGLDPEKPGDVHQAALLLAERFKIGGVRREPRLPWPTGKTKPAPLPSPVSKEISPKMPLPQVTNAALDFELKGLDPCHPYLSKRGFLPATITHFGLGHCARGLMNGRIVIPLHNSSGKLIGYAGRLVDDTAVNEANPKYKFPGERTHNGTIYEFRKSLFLYNAHRLSKPVDDLVVVEGFTSVWWLWQTGHGNAVAVMGASCSPEQAKDIVELVRPSGRVWVFPDGDDAGERCGESVLYQVAPHRFVRWVKLTGDKQPTDCPADELVSLFDQGVAVHGAIK